MLPKLKLFTLTFLILISSYSQNNTSDKKFIKSKIELYKKTNIDSTIFYFRKLQKISTNSDLIDAIIDEGIVLDEHGMISKAEIQLLKALELSKKNENKSLEAKCKHSLGYHYIKTNNLNKSYTYYLGAKDIYLNTKDWINYYKTLSSIGYHLETNGEFEEAQKNYKEAITFFKKNNENASLISTSINLGNLISQTKGSKEGLKIFTDLLENKSINQAQQSKIFYNISLNYYDQKDFLNANKYITNAINLTQNNKNTDLLIDLFSWKAEYLFQLKNYSEANSYYKKALVLANKYNDLPFQKSIYRNLIEINIKQNNYDSISKWINNLDEIEIELDNRKEIDIKEKFELEKKLELQKKINLETELNFFKSKNQQMVLIYVIIIGLIFISLLSTSYYYYKKNAIKSLKLSKSKEINLLRQSEIEKLEKIKIKDELKKQKREMLSSLIFIRNLNTEVDKIIQNIDQIHQKSVITKDDIDKLKNEIINRSNKQIEKINFDSKLIKTHKKFFSDLLNLHPDLSNNELKILAFLRVGLTTKEIADIQNVTIEAVRKARYRVRKKLKLESDESLEQYLILFE